EAAEAMSAGAAASARAAAEAAAASARAAAEASAAAQIRQLEAQIQSMTEAATQNADSLDAQAPPRAVRHRLPGERASVTHKFSLAGHEGYITVGLYPNGSPGEIFIRMAKEGSTVSGLMDSFATAISLALQHGVPLRVLCEKFAHTRFEPSGWTGNPEIGFAKSIMDYIFRWIQLRFLSGQQLDLFAGLGPAANAPAVPLEGTVSAPHNTVSLNAQEEPARPSTSFPSVSSAIASHVTSNLPEVTPQTVLDREARETRAQASAEPVPQSISDQDIFNNAPGSAPSSTEPHTPEPSSARPRGHCEDRLPPQQGIAPQQVAADQNTRNGNTAPAKNGFEDRGIYHAADAMKSMYDMGDAPSCATCGAIMTRSGSCYRCMSCGNTSGCS
ncbi:MAG TPA: hypothetical protein VJY65_09980, partial [Chloroflexota bacterium]|nr:hypothetical protein [Chloroflexota bacterium]